MENVKHRRVAPTKGTRDSVGISSGGTRIDGYMIIDLSAGHRTRMPPTVIFMLWAVCFGENLERDFVIAYADSLACFFHHTRRAL